jgi:hypothetical protein
VAERRSWIHRCAHLIPRGGNWVALPATIHLAARACRQGVRALPNGLVSDLAVRGGHSFRLGRPSVGSETLPHGENSLVGLAGSLLGDDPVRSGGQQRLTIGRALLSNLYQPGQKGLLRNVTGNGHTPPLQLLQQTHQTRREGGTLQLPQLPRVRHLALREVQEVLTALQVRELRLRRPVGEQLWVPTSSG